MAALSSLSPFSETRDLTRFYSYHVAREICTMRSPAGAALALRLDWKTDSTFWSKSSQPSSTVAERAGMRAFAHIVEKHAPDRWKVQCQLLEESLKRRLAHRPGANMTPDDVIRHLLEGTDGSDSCEREIAWLRQHLGKACNPAKSTLGPVSTHSLDQDLHDVVAVAKTYAKKYMEVRGTFGLCSLQRSF